MQNENFRDANFVSAPVPSGTKSGDFLRLGGLNAVAATDRARTGDVAPFDSVGAPNALYNWGGGNPDGNASVWLQGSYTFEENELEVTEWGQEIYILPDGSELTTEPDDGEVVDPVANLLYGHALNTKTDDPGDLTVRLAN